MKKLIAKDKMIHSIKTDRKKTFNYWDYLFWGITKLKPKKILMLGLGGGTVIQLMANNLEVDSEIVGVEINKDFFEKIENESWIDYPKLRKVNTDAVSFLKNTSENFDLIIVDTYTEVSIAKEMISKESIKLMEACLTKNGKLFFHVTEPLAKYIIFGMEQISEHATLSSTIINQSKSIFKYYEGYMFWSSLMLVFSKDKDLNLSKNNNKDKYKELNNMFSNMRVSKKDLDKLFIKELKSKTYIEQAKEEYVYIENRKKMLNDKNSEILSKLFNFTPSTENNNYNNKEFNKKIESIIIHNSILKNLREDGAISFDANQFLSKDVLENQKKYIKNNIFKLSSFYELI